MISTSLIIITILMAIGLLAVGAYFLFFKKDEPFLGIEIPVQFIPELVTIDPTVDNTDFKTPSVAQPSCISKGVAPSSGTYIRIDGEHSIYVDGKQWNIYKNNSIYQNITINTDDANDGSVGSYTTFTSIVNGFKYFCCQIGNEIITLYFNNFTWIVFTYRIKLDATFITSSVHLGNHYLYVRTPATTTLLEPIVHSYILSTNDWLPSMKMRPFQTVGQSYGLHLSAFKNYISISEGRNVLHFKDGKYTGFTAMSNSVDAILITRDDLLFVSHGQKITVFCKDMTGNFVECVVISTSSMVDSIHYVYPNVLIAGTQNSTDIYTLSRTKDSISKLDTVSGTQAIRPYFVYRDGTDVVIENSDFKCNANIIIV